MNAAARAELRTHLTAALALLDAPEPAAAAPPAPAPAAAAVRPARICVDAGHGGHDPGAVAGAHREKDLALAYALELENELLRRGHQIRSTRTTDVFVPLAMRAQHANAFEADCFVSLHANAADSKLANGAWVIHDDAAGPAGGVALARHVFAELAKVQGVVDADATVEVFPDASPQVGGRQLAVLSQTRMPAILVELGFMTNEEDLRALEAPATLRAVVLAIADGIEAWLRGRPM